MSNQIELSIIIVNYQTKDFLASCLSSIFKTSKDLDVEVIVIDNDSKDDSVKLIKEFFPSVILIENRTNRGFAAASNQGLKIMKGDYALLLNPDTEILNGALQEMLEFMKNNHRVGILGCKIIDEHGNLQRSCFPPPSLIREFSDILYKLKIEKILPTKMTLHCYVDVIESSDQPFVVGWVSGACLMIKKETIQDIGLLDENLFMFCEDADWCIRADKKEWKVMYYPSVSIFHCREGSSKTDINEIALCIDYAYKSKLYFAKKHFGRTGTIITKLISLIELLSKITVTYLNLRPGISRQGKDIRLKGYKLSLRSVLNNK